MNVPHLSLTLPKGELVKEQMVEIFNFARPQWELDQIEIEDLSKRGFVNVNLICHTSSREDALYIRVINPIMLENLPQLALWRKFVAKHELSAKLLATFENGYVEDCLQGQSITWETHDLVADSVVPVASEMARFHRSIVLEDAKASGIDQGVVMLSEKWLKFLFNDIRSVGRVGEDFFKEFQTIDDILHEVKEVRDKLTARDATIVVCHGDINPTNIILGEKAHFVDYESLSIDYAVFDVAFYFLLLNFVFGESPIPKYPTVKYRHRFCHEYLTALHEANNEPLPVTDEELEKFEVDMEFGKLLAILVFFQYLYAFHTDQLNVPTDVETVNEFLRHIWLEYMEEKTRIMAEY